MKFLERVFDLLEGKQVPLMALATSVAGEVGSQAIAADSDCGLEFDAQIAEAVVLEQVLTDF
jgi:hypothetical protein